jgi:DNA end-binding protein Ku
MALRPYWNGYLKLSLVSCPIQLFPAISEQEKIRVYLVNRKTGNRIKYCKLDSETGKPVGDDAVVRGYEVAKGRFVEITDDEMKAIAVESTHTIEIEQFVPRNEIDELYLNFPYFIAPQGPVGSQAFAVIREAIRKEGMVALGRVVFTTREHVIALEPRGKGMVGLTLRYPYEVRREADYFNNIPDEKIPKNMLDLAVNIIESKAGHFRPEKFEDHYQKALKELIERKQRGERIERPKEFRQGRVIDLMDALRDSLAGERHGTRRHSPQATARERSRGRSRARTGKAAR